ncbi:NIPSNAP family protein [Cnuibacter physcomitrellae]|uniref:NIPSNAP family protein n=1 Tax=Cnuibacter physcomitrellae TaxID=1619308 RepID=UPI002175EB8B|nr:NIPSNAP family protein [Cnuibacter physcomitrellae]MCS5498280.1 NIPSNAP family protein [Cnuibacter physcomitrellae]
MTAAEDCPLVELRHYHMRDLAAREYFDRRSKAVTFPLFVKYGFRIRRFWADAANPLDVHYLVGWESEEEKERLWAQFRSDPLWTQMVEADGYVAPMEWAESVMLVSAVEPETVF